MLKLSHINLIRTTSFYRSDTLKGLVTTALSAPIKYFTSAKNTEFFLKDINLSIAKGERVAFFGKNGSGKSTLCRIIAGQLFPSSGEIETSFKTSLFSQIEYNFYKELTGRENLKYFIKFLYPHENKQAQEHLLQKAIEFSELNSQIDRQLETYSAGMLTRLASSLILVKPHDLLILDELQTHADLNFKLKIADRLNDIIKTSNTVIMVSHYVDDLVKICTRGVVLDSGKIVFDGNIQKAASFYKVLNGAADE